MITASDRWIAAIPAGEARGCAGEVVRIRSDRAASSSCLTAMSASTRKGTSDESTAAATGAPATTEATTRLSDATPRALIPTTMLRRSRAKRNSASDPSAIASGIDVAAPSIASSRRGGVAADDSRQAPDTRIAHVMSRRCACSANIVTAACTPRAVSTSGRAEGITSADTTRPAATAIPRRIANHRSCGSGTAAKDRCGPYRRGHWRRFSSPQRGPLCVHVRGSLEHRNALGPEIAAVDVGGIGLGDAAGLEQDRCPSWSQRSTGASPVRANPDQIPIISVASNSCGAVSVIRWPVASIGWVATSNR